MTTRLTYAGAFLPPLLSGRVDPVIIDPRTFDARKLVPFTIAGAEWVTLTKIVATSGGATDSVLMDSATLRPIAEWRSDQGGSVSITYDGSRIHGSIDTTLGLAPVAAPELEAIIRALPLTTGYAARFPMYWVHGQGNRGGDLYWESIYVVGVDTICQCWSVNTAGAIRTGFRRFEIPLKP